MVTPEKGCIAGSQSVADEESISYLNGSVKADARVVNLFLSEFLDLRLFLAISLLFVGVFLLSLIALSLFLIWKLRSVWFCLCERRVLVVFFGGFWRSFRPRKDDWRNDAHPLKFQPSDEV